MDFHWKLSFLLKKKEVVNSRFAYFFKYLYTFVVFMLSDIQLYLSDAYDYAPVCSGGSHFIERNATKGRLNDSGFFCKDKRLY